MNIVLVTLAWFVALVPLLIVFAAWVGAVLKGDRDTIELTSVIIGSLLIAASVLYLVQYYGGNK